MVRPHSDARHQALTSDTCISPMWARACSRPPHVPFHTALLMHLALANATPCPDAYRLEGVLKNYMVDFTERMQAIQAGLEETANAPDATEEQVAVAEKHLEELMDIVESIDFARDLRSIGGLPVLKALMRSPHPSLRWRAADVVATCAQNNPPVQVRRVLLPPAGVSSCTRLRRRVPASS